MALVAVRLRDEARTVSRRCGGEWKLDVSYESSRYDLFIEEIFFPIKELDGRLEQGKLHPSNKHSVFLDVFLVFHYDLLEKARTS